MAKTPYVDLGSQDILSGHISGLQHDVNKIQDVLNMKTTNVENHELEAVVDQDDPSLRYRIYEGSVRNWLTDPEPVIYRNGVMVDSSEYEIQAPYGVIVFHTQQRAQDRISSDFTYITNESLALEGKAKQSDVANLQSDVSLLEDRVEILEGSGGGLLEIDGLYPYYPVSGSYFTHFRREYHPIKSDANAYNPETHIPAFNVLVYGNTVDAFPLPVERKMRFNRAGIMVGDSSGGGAKCKIGIYKDNGNMRPDNLLLESPEIAATVGNWGYANIDWELEAGFYWIAVHHGLTASYNGLDERSSLQVVKFNAESFLKNLAERPNPHTAYGGYRATGVTYGSSMPSTYPAGGELFKRNVYISPWLVVE